MLLPNRLFLDKRLGIDGWVLERLNFLFVAQLVYYLDLNNGNLVLIILLFCEQEFRYYGYPSRFSPFLSNKKFIVPIHILDRIRVLHFCFLFLKCSFPDYQTNVLARFGLWSRSVFSVQPFYLEPIAAYRYFFLQTFIVQQLFRDLFDLLGLGIRDTNHLSQLQVNLESSMLKLWCHLYKQLLVNMCHNLQHAVLQLLV